MSSQGIRTIREHESLTRVVQVIDQRRLPFELVWLDLHTVQDAAAAIRDMAVRGAPLIGVTAAYGMYLASLENESNLESAAQLLLASRPTAVNLRHAVEAQLQVAQRPGNLPSQLLEAARQFAENDVQMCADIGRHGVELIRAISERKNGEVVNVLTHCNAGWLACVEHGTATSAIYQAFDAGIPIHVWVDETRPRNQGASLTAWELGHRGVPHTVIADNAGGHLMQHGMVDLVIVGSDRTTRNGDVANKIGTYLKALAARDNAIPFYVALPGTTFDFSLKDGLSEIPIEERSEEEVTHLQGWDGKEVVKVRLTPANSRALNPGFDVTPARLVTGLITERGICAATPEGIAGLYPEAFGPTT